MSKPSKSIIWILALTILLIACNTDTCTSDNEAVCELEDIATFEVEDNAKIIIGVFDKEYGKDLVANWNITYPNHENLLEYGIVPSDDNGELLLNLLKYDLIQMKSQHVPLYFEHLSPFDDSFGNILKNELLHKFSSQVNQEAFYFMPFDAEGLLFAYNKTMLEEFGVDLSDGDDDGMPDAIDSFEKIVKLADTWRKDNINYLDQELENIFAFPLNDQMAMLPFLQNSDYRLIQGQSAEMMNLDDDLILALENLKKLCTYAWRFDKKLDNDTVWNYEQVLIDQSAPFLLVGNWMYYDHYQTSKAYDLVFTKLPTLNGTDLATISSVSGFVLNKDQCIQMQQTWP